MGLPSVWPDRCAQPPQHRHPAQFHFRMAMRSISLWNMWRADPCSSFSVASGPLRSRQLCKLSVKSPSSSTMPTITTSCIAISSQAISCAAVTISNIYLEPSPYRSMAKFNEGRSPAARRLLLQRNESFSRRAAQRQRNGLVSGPDSTRHRDIDLIQPRQAGRQAAEQNGCVLATNCHNRGS